MNIQKMVKSAIAANLGTLGAEDLVIGSVTVSAVLAEAEKSEDIMGGTREERRLTASFPTDSALKLRTGNKVTAREQTWKVESVSSGQSMTHVTLIDPNRVDL